LLHELLLTPITGVSAGFLDGIAAFVRLELVAIAAFVLLGQVQWLTGVSARFLDDISAFLHLGLVAIATFVVLGQVQWLRLKVILIKAQQAGHDHECGPI
jgi:hypothetical protein